jgi:Arc/MetJ-type ribon-helix-helix transcriptional regulator
MTQLVTRMDDRLVTEVDRLVAEGVVASRSEAVRRGLELLVDHHRRAAVGQAIVDGYRQHPQTDQEVGWADEATRAMIAEEPW